MTEQQPNMQKEEGALPEGVTRNIEGAYAIDEDGLPSLPENLPGSSVLPEAIQQKINALEEEIRKTIDARASGQFAPGQGPRVDIDAFQKAMREWDSLSPEEKAKAIESGKKKPLLTDFREVA